MHGIPWKMNLPRSLEQPVRERLEKKCPFSLSSNSMVIFYAVW